MNNVQRKAVYFKGNKLSCEIKFIFSVFKKDRLETANINNLVQNTKVDRGVPSLNRVQAKQIASLYL